MQSAGADAVGPGDSCISNAGVLLSLAEALNGTFQEALKIASVPR